MTAGLEMDAFRRIPTTSYERPAADRPDLLRLDGNEGRQLDETSLGVLSRAPTALLREYPNPRELEAVIGDALGVDRERIVVTTGGDDALDRCVRASVTPGTEVVLPIPTFEMLFRFVDLAGGAIRRVRWNNDYPTEEVIDRIGPETTLVAMVSPNNPTGRVAQADDLRRVAAAASRCLVVLDHAYVEYSDADLTEVAAEFDNVVVVRTFSKAWGLAGCRVGYAIAAPPVARALRNVGNPYPITGLAATIVRDQLQSGTSSMRDHVRMIRDEREAITRQLTERGLGCAPSHANFVFVECGKRAQWIRDVLDGAGIVVRAFPHRPEIATGLRVSLPGRRDAFAALARGFDLALAPDALLFDMDGVLSDVRESYDACIVATAADFGVELSDDDVFAARRGGNAANPWTVTQRLLGGRGIEAPLDQVVDRFQAHYLGGEARPGLHEQERALIDGPRFGGLATRFRIGVVTGRPRAEAERFLERNGLRRWVDTLVGMEDAAPKPDPEPVRLALRRLGVETAWLVGDTPDDIRAARDAGAVPVGVVAPGQEISTTREILSAAGAVAVLDTIDGLEALTG